MRRILVSALLAALVLPGSARSDPESLRRFLSALPEEDRTHPYVAKNSFNWCEPGLGCAQSPPFALTIEVRDRAPRGLPCDVHQIGPLVKAALFPGWNDFQFRVVFANAKPSLDGVGAFADPRSHWYDIFFGYYTVTWEADRPFAYEPFGSSFAFRFDDLIRLGEADWNYFSNRIYGVPSSEVEQHDDPDLSDVKTKQEQEHVGRYWWDVVEIENVSVVGPYRAADGAPIEIFDPCLTPVWRLIFGTHAPIESHEESYAPVRLRARGFACWETLEEAGAEPRFRTHIFGGTINMDFADPVLNERFLARQLDSIRKTIDGDGNLRCDESFLQRRPSP